MMGDKRYKEIMSDLGMSNSRSLLLALQQVANETAQEIHNKKCKWTRSFDQHFNIGCVNETKERANGNFKSCDDMSAKWEFDFCPYCGGKIELAYPDTELTQPDKERG